MRPPRRRVDNTQAEIVASVAPTERTCEWCGTSYRRFGRTRRARYCSMACRNADPATAERARVNGAVTRKGNACRACETPIRAKQTYCAVCWPRPRRPAVCRRCGVVVPTKFARFCAGCRRPRKPPPTSTCSVCGAEVPGYRRKYCRGCWAVTRRLNCKVDANQAEIFKGLRDLGVSVIDTSALGGGAPDAIAGVHGVMVLLEIKNRAARGKLNPLQVTWHSGWKGPPVVVAYTLEEAIAGIEARLGRRLVA